MTLSAQVELSPELREPICQAILAAGQEENARLLAFSDERHGQNTTVSFELSGPKRMVEALRELVQAVNVRAATG